MSTREQGPFQTQSATSDTSLAVPVASRAESNNSPIWKGVKGARQDDKNNANLPWWGVIIVEILKVEGASRMNKELRTPR